MKLYATTRAGSGVFCVVARNHLGKIRPCVTAYGDCSKCMVPPVYGHVWNGKTWVVQHDETCSDAAVRICRECLEEDRE